MQSTIRNRTIFCHDNLEILQGINSRSIDLVYLDPPFNTNKVFTQPLGDSTETVGFSDIFREEDVKDEWLQSIKEDNEKLHSFLESVKVIEGRTSYNFCYLSYMAIRLIEMHRVLKDTGSIYLHCDPTMSHYLKILLDIIFGGKNFRSEIVWRIGWVSGYKTKKKAWIRNHDIILYYVKNEKADKLFNKEYIPYVDDYVRRDGSKPTGKGIPIEDTWNCSSGDILDSIMIKSFSTEKEGYPTQKPLQLLERIIKASSNESDVVLDPFCGCATTCVQAEKLKRKWIGIDISQIAYELVKDRLKKEISDPNDLFDWNKEIAFKTNPPKRTDQGEDSRPKKWVYVISNPQFVSGMYKVGITANVEKRLDSYQTADPGRGYKVEYKKFSPHFREIEKYIHETFESRHEWVRAPLFDIVQAIENYISGNEYNNQNSQENLLVAEE